jgi:hypothetical protein
LAGFWAIQFDENARRMLNEVRWRPSKLGIRALCICCCSFFLFSSQAWSAEDQSASGQAAGTDVPPNSGVVLPTERILLHVFLLMGQSNMAGYGCVADGDTCPPDWKIPVPRVLVLDGQGQIDSATPQQPIKWRAGSQPLHLGQPLTARYGLGMDFAKAYIGST